MIVIIGPQTIEDSQIGRAVQRLHGGAPGFAEFVENNRRFGDCAGDDFPYEPMGLVGCQRGAAVGDELLKIEHGLHASSVRHP
jgi:hypothetical protein